ncbi:ABC transporter permease [Paenibacillus athensensis]|uniref:ABC transporter permease n=1 Tax=Paenibacillus athensensis TaxID=1967502 RepID=A0A4Y8QAT0_9BACL|nr:ABC transporter permease [Paenibacillus athensensis]MCD1259046.1 ABC transporter permease [Paenibacillus athensensis]
MKLKDYFRLGWDQLQRRKVVTALCAVGIAIGSASIMVALAFGESIQHYSQKQMSYYLKTDEITIENGNGGSDGGITKEKLNLIRTFPHVTAVASFQDLQYFTYKLDDGKSGTLRLIATEPETIDVFDNKFQQGGPSDSDNSVALTFGSMLGLMDEKTQTVRSKLMEQNPNKELKDTFEQLDRIPTPLYQKQLHLIPVSFNGPESGQTQAGGKAIDIPMRVTGVLKKSDGIPDYMLTGDKRAFVSLEVGARITELMKGSSAGSSPVFSQVKVKVDSSAHVNEVVELIRKLRLNPQSNLYQEDRMKGEFAIIRLLLTGVGLFVLFVASISIVVAMTMSTHQRRRQIGIMKVLGANLRQIRNMFIVESSLLGMLGGLCGIVLSYWVIWGINAIIIKFSGGPPGEDVQVLFVSLWILPVGMFFAILTGVLSGLYPAVKASRTDALTAIKRE